VAQQAVLLSHLPVEDLGSLEWELVRRGFVIMTLEPATAQFPVPEIQESDLLVVLDGSIGGYDSENYPLSSHAKSTRPAPKDG
jgi:hypothetical protein